jgi:hypothetical protein
MARSKTVESRRVEFLKPAPPKEAYSIEEFCLTHSISRAAFYVLRAAGEAPDVFYVGARVLISRESAAQWRKRRTEIARLTKSAPSPGEAPTAI